MAWSYWLLFAVQTAGAMVIYWIGVPLYKRVTVDPNAHVPGKMVVISFSAIALMQIAYWGRLRLVPMPPQVTPHVLFAHVVLFVAHLVFDVAAVIFILAFVFRPPKLVRPFFRYAVTLAAIFALFCYSLELERFGKAFLDYPPRNPP